MKNKWKNLWAGFSAMWKKLIEENKLVDAKNKAQLISNQYDRKDMIDKINSLK